MKKDYVAVATLDSQIYYGIIEELKKAKIDFIVRKPGESIPLSVKAVITTPDEAKLVQHHTLFTCNQTNIREAVDHTIRTLRGIPGKTPKTLVLGIDPGKTMGLAVVVDGTIMQTASYRNTKELIQAAKREILGWGASETIVKVGRSQPSTRPIRNRKTRQYNVGEQAGRLAEVMRRELGGKAKVIFVDEKYTTTATKRLKVKRGEKDKTSAVEIALR